MIGVVLFIILVIVAFIYFLVEFKRMRHKIFAIVLIALILFLYISATFFVFKGKTVDYKTVPGVINAGGIYLSWIGGVFWDNLKTITTNAIKMGWGSNETTSS